MCALNSICSSSLLLLNHYLASSEVLVSVAMTLLLQTLISLALLLPSISIYPPKQAYILGFPLAILFLGMLITSLLAMQTLPIHTVIVFRSINPVVMAIFSRPTRIEVLSLIACVFGALLFGVSGGQFDLLGCVYMVMNNIFSIMYYTMAKKAVIQLPIPALTRIVANSLCTLPYLFGWIIVMEPVNMSQLSISPALVVSGLVGVGIAYSYVRLSESLPPLSLIVLSNANKAMVLLMEAILRPSVELDPQGYLGLGICLIASFVYSIQSDKTKQE